MNALNYIVVVLPIYNGSLCTMNFAVLWTYQLILAVASSTLSLQEWIVHWIRKAVILTRSVSTLNGLVKYLTKWSEIVEKIESKVQLWCMLTICTFTQIWDKCLYQSYFQEFFVWKSCMHIDLFMYSHEKNKFGSWFLNQNYCQMPEIFPKLSLILHVSFSFWHWW